MTFRVLDVLRPRGATWSGEVISSRPGPSGGPFMTHLLPGGGVPRVHGAGSPVPLRLPHFATPRSVRHLATVVAGAYPLRRPPDAWSPGLPAPPGPCYWLVASGTPMGWRGGFLAAGLVRSTVCYYCLGGCSALVTCARRSRQGWGSGPLPVLASTVGLPPALASLAVRVAGCLARCPFPSPAGTPFHAVCAFRGLGPVALWVHAACPLRVCAPVLPRRTPPPPPSGLVWRAPYAQFRGGAPVGLFQAVGAPPCVLPRSRSPLF